MNNNEKVIPEFNSFVDGGDSYYRDADYMNNLSEASSFAREIMGDSIDCLIITDTPGVSDKVPLNIASDADVYILMMKDDNLEEFDLSIEKIIPKIAGSNVLFIYRNGNTYTTLEGYN